MSVPDQLRPIIGKREITRSLGTKDYDEAKRLVVLFVAEAFAEIAAAQRQLVGESMTGDAIVHFSEPGKDEEPPLDDRGAMLEYELRHERELRQIDADNLRLNQSLLRQAEGKLAYRERAKASPPQADSGMTISRMWERDYRSLNGAALA